MNNQKVGNRLRRAISLIRVMGVQDYKELFFGLDVIIPVQVSLAPPHRTED